MISSEQKTVLIDREIENFMSLSSSQLFDKVSHLQHCIELMSNEIVSLKEEVILNKQSFYESLNDVVGGKR